MTAVTKAQVRELARRKYGKKVELSENKNAPTVAEKEVQRAKRQERIARKNQLEADLGSLKDPNGELLKAARFALDVDGDEPSWSQLREAVEVCNKVREIKDELQAIKEEAGRYSGYICRWSVSELVNIGGVLMNRVHEQADTLEELVAKMEKS